MVDQKHILGLPDAYARGLEERIRKLEARLNFEQPALIVRPAADYTPTGVTTDNFFNSVTGGGLWTTEVLRKNWPDANLPTSGSARIRAPRDGYYVCGVQIQQDGSPGTTVDYYLTIEAARYEGDGTTVIAGLGADWSTLIGSAEAYNAGIRLSAAFAGAVSWFDEGDIFGWAGYWKSSATTLLIDAGDSYMSMVRIGPI